MKWVNEIKQKPYLLGLLIVAAILLAWSLIQPFSVDGQFIFPAVSGLAYALPAIFSGISGALGPILAFFLILLLVSPTAFFGLLILLVLFIVGIIALVTGNFTLFLVIVGMVFFLMLLGGGRKK